MSNLPLVSKKSPEDFRNIQVDDISFGHGQFNVIAGPCAVESEEQLYHIAEQISDMGIPFLRGGAFKPRSSPYAFQGLQKEGLKILKQASESYQLKIVTEVLDTSLIELVYPYADILQVGARNMMNYQFLKELGKVDKPILLKRGISATIKEWLAAAEYIMLGGNEKIILCERGIRTFDSSVRNTFDLAAIALAKQMTHLPVIADPSQGTGVRSLIEPTSMAAIAVGADGLMIEVHNKPEEALSDGFQSLYLDQLRALLPKIKAQTEFSGITFNQSLSKINI